MTRLDRGLLLAVLALLGIGLVQVYSSSFVFAIESRGDGLFFFKRQLVFTLCAIAALIFTAYVPFRWIKTAGWMLWPIAAIGIAATMVPGLGIKAGGATRWLRLPGGNVFEPSELLKIALPLLMATYLARRADGFKGFEWPLRAFLFLAPLALVLRQPDFGTFFICSIVFVAMLFAFGLKWRFVIGAIMVSVPSFYFLVMQVPYRRARILSFLDPWADPEVKGFQVIQSMMSFQAGGLAGSGLGQGQGKLFFLPEAHTDFTMAVLGEEMGFIGVFVVLALYGFVVVRGLQLATRTQDTFAKAVALGLSLTFAFSVFINTGMVMGLLPTKGLTLPFLSYGGSSLMVTCFLFGILLNIERQDRIAIPFGKSAEKTLRRLMRTSNARKQRN